jgi:hypothetical protein
MHPAGIKFGLSHGLLELNGADVVLSGHFLESISEMARRKVQRRKRVMGIWDEAVRAGLQRNIAQSFNAPRQEYVPFFTGLDRIVLETLMPIAEKAKMGRREGKYFFTNRTFWDRFRRDVRRPHMRLEAAAAWRLHFRETYAVVRQLCAENTPENMRHAELLALCQLDGWDRSPNKLTIEDFLA